MFFLLSVCLRWRVVRPPPRFLAAGGLIAAHASIIRAQLSPSSRLMAVVKANGYGHGAIESARASLAGGADFLGVATVSEACELRDDQIDAPILVLGSSDPLEAPHAAELNIALGVGDAVQIGRILTILETARPTDPLQVHLKIDTGMRRFGVPPEDAVTVAVRLAKHPLVELTGIYSHFSESDGESACRMSEQLDSFLAVLAEFGNHQIDSGIAHISNSAALLRNRTADLDMVRAGICLYGISPSEHVELFHGMTPPLEWRASVQRIAEMMPGDRTGYAGTYVATEHERIALLPIGYADGYPRNLSNCGWVGYHGHRLPVRGRISMDQCAVGIPADLVLSVGDELTILGPPESGAPDANQLGDLIGTIGYEIVSRLSRRIPVEYI
jgi:alanine racemase